MAKIFLILAIVPLAFLLVGLIISFFIVRAYVLNTEEVGNPYCPNYACADGKPATSEKTTTA